MSQRSMTAALSVLVSAGLVLTACSSDTSSADTAVDARGCITDFDANTDYFPDKSTLLDAKNFSVDYHNSYQVLTVNQPFPGASPESYVLVKCGAPEPELTGALAAAPKITTPIQSLYSASTTHLPLITELGQLDILTGVANASYVNGDDIRARIAEGKITEYASGKTVNVEKVVAENPDVLMTQGTDDPSYAKLRAAGIPVVANAEYLENTALGRAEWIKMMAALTGTEAKAATLYDRIRSDYEKVAQVAAGAEKKPVLNGTMYQGTWYMPAGGSYIGEMLRAAGATYPWESDPATGSLQLNFETVYAQNGTAPIWIVMSDWATTGDAVAEDQRYGQLSAVKDGQVWSGTKDMGPTGGNNFYQLGVLRPDLVLGDLVAIVHPELAPNHEFAFYRPVPRA
ncbi:ABC transporter substrate-binding protein [Prescottella agglutinans]|uniref:Iron complex transport system substrate-binding protein n=1 Tax=Prescottella agglutinans TaxID=1644129 RepID=A0ABT6MCL3_9NOCA|nr:ABC transporter substrate-binding protein [Prescottella agglutinans]MDH6282061.1 iron complex transport system substrate-binding protein [Prescottella agglutinans]